jgi:hypothetical protein
MSERDQESEELHNLHRAMGALIRGVDPQVVMAVLAMNAATMIVTHVPPAQRSGQLRKFDEGVRSFTRMIGDDLIRTLGKDPHR